MEVGGGFCGINSDIVNEVGVLDPQGDESDIGQALATDAHLTSVFLTLIEVGIGEDLYVAVACAAFVLFSGKSRHTSSLCDWSSDVCFFFFKQKTAYEITV